MASLLRQIVAGPRARHPEAGLDLCYVADNIIATSGPSGTYPQLAYRNPLKQLVKFLDDKHGDQWAIWEFRAEGTGYPDEEVYNRIYHYPWPDHHPPPFALIPLIMGSMRHWLKPDSTEENDEPAKKPLEKLSDKLEAIKTDQDNSGDSSARQSSSPQLPQLQHLRSEDQVFHDAPSSLDEEKDQSNGDAAGGSSTDTSGPSTRDSSRRRKEVRWRESTFAAPKAENDKNGKSLKASKIKATKPNGTASKTKSDRVIVVHCKAGKGRSGTVSCSYLISEEGWSVQDALKRFTERRMKPGFGAGVSIPSQLRWIGYVDRWTRHGKKYIDRPVEILEIHVWGLRDRVKVAVRGFRDAGRKMEVAHVFKGEEKELVKMADPAKQAPKMAGVVDEAIKKEKEERHGSSNDKSGSDGPADDLSLSASNEKLPETTSDDRPQGDAVFRPSKRILLESSDANIDFERRGKGVSGLTMVTSVAHVWFNAFFEGQGPEHEGRPRDSGVFEIDWVKMDGIKGSSRKGVRAFDRIAVVWKVDISSGTGTDVKVPEHQNAVMDEKAADWKRGDDEGHQRDLGVRKADSASSSDEHVAAPTKVTGTEQAAHDATRTLPAGTSTTAPANASQ